MHVNQGKAPIARFEAESKRQLGLRLQLAELI